MENHTQPHPQVRCIRVAEVAKRIGVGKSTIWRWVTNIDAAFPQPFKMASRVTVWYAHEIDAYIASKRPTMH